DGVASAGADTAHAMAQVDPVVALRALDRTIVNGERDGVTLAERHDLNRALHARALLGQHELAAGEVPSSLRAQDRHLYREGKVAVEVLVRTVEIAGDVLQQERRRPRLPGSVAELQEIRVGVRIALIEAHAFVPRVGDARQMRIKRSAQAG